MLVAAPSAALAQEYGPRADGCYWYWNGQEYVRRRCPQNDGSSYFYQPDGRGGWTYAMQCAATPAFNVCLMSSGLYIESYADGSSYVENAQRAYLIYHRDGTTAEIGYYDANGIQRSTWYSGKNSAAMRNRSLTYWAVLQIGVDTILRSNPTAFNGLITMDQAANAYAICLHQRNSSTDWDYDGRTGFNELAEACAS